MALGLQLSVSEQQLSSIKSKYTNISKCKHQMFQLALKNKITWRQILQALYRIGERATAEKVCQIYEIPAESLSQLMHPDSTKPVSGVMLWHFSLEIFTQCYPCPCRIW